MHRLALILPLLTACDPGLGGDWEGELACSDEDFQGTMGLSLALNRVEADEYVGTGSQSFTGEVQIGGAWRSIEGSLLLEELVAMVDGDDVSIVGTTTDCYTEIDGEEIESGCGQELGIAATWDGADTLSVADGDCAGELTR